MLKEAIYHRPKQNWAYGYDNETVHLRIRTKRGDVERVEVIHGDKCMPWSAIETEAMRIMGSDELFDYWEAAVQTSMLRFYTNRWRAAAMVHGEGLQRRSACRAFRIVRISVSQFH